jgi:hypothetical protein
MTFITLTHLVGAPGPRAEERRLDLVVETIVGFSQYGDGLDMLNRRNNRTVVFVTDAKRQFLVWETPDEVRDIINAAHPRAAR